MAAIEPRGDSEIMSTLLGSRWSQPLDRDGRPVGTRRTYRCRFQIER